MRAPSRDEAGDERTSKPAHRLLLLALMDVAAALAVRVQDVRFREWRGYQSSGVLQLVGRCGLVPADPARGDAPDGLCGAARARGVASVPLAEGAGVGE